MESRIGSQANPKVMLAKDGVSRESVRDDFEWS